MRRVSCPITKAMWGVLNRVQGQLRKIDTMSINCRPISKEIRINGQSIAACTYPAKKRLADQIKKNLQELRSRINVGGLKTLLAMECAKSKRPNEQNTAKNSIKIANIWLIKNNPPIGCKDRNCSKPLKEKYCPLSQINETAKYAQELKEVSTAAALQSLNRQ